MGQSYIVIPGFDDMYIRVDIARNMTPGGKIGERYILVYSEYDSIEKDIKERRYSLIDDLEICLLEAPKDTSNVENEDGRIVEFPYRSSYCEVYKPNGEIMMKTGGLITYEGFENVRHAIETGVICWVKVCFRTYFSLFSY